MTLAREIPARSIVIFLPPSNTHLRHHPQLPIHENITTNRARHSTHELSTWATRRPFVPHTETQRGAGRRCQTKNISRNQFFGRENRHFLKFKTTLFALKVSTRVGRATHVVDRCRRFGRRRVGSGDATDHRRNVVTAICACQEREVKKK